MKIIMRAVSMTAVLFAFRTMHLPKLKQFAKSLEILDLQFGTFDLS
jgi:hypothetical protein